MTDPIREAEASIVALQSLEQLAGETVTGSIRLNIREGKITSAVALREIRPEQLEVAAPIAAIAAEHMYGGIEFDVRGGRIVGWTALPRRLIA